MEHGRELGHPLTAPKITKVPSGWTAVVAAVVRAIVRVVVAVVAVVVVAVVAVVKDQVAEPLY